MIVGPVDQNNANSSILCTRDCSFPLRAPVQRKLLGITIVPMRDAFRHILPVSPKVRVLRRFGRYISTHQQKSLCAGKAVNPKMQTYPRHTREAALMMLAKRWASPSCKKKVLRHEKKSGHFSKRKILASENFYVSVVITCAALQRNVFKPDVMKPHLILFEVTSSPNLLNFLGFYFLGKNSTYSYLN